MNAETDPILEYSITQIALSNEFIEMCKVNEFNTLKDILKFPVNALLNKPDFNHRMLIELYSILKMYNLEKHLIER